MFLQQESQAIKALATKGCPFLLAPRDLQWGILSSQFLQDSLPKACRYLQSPRLELACSMMAAIRSDMYCQTSSPLVRHGHQTDARFTPREDGQSQANLKTKPSKSESLFGGESISYCSKDWRPAYRMGIIGVRRHFLGGSEEVV